MQKSARKFYRNYNQSASPRDYLCGEHEVDHGLENSNEEASSPKDAWRAYFDDSKITSNEDIMSVKDMSNVMTPQRKQRYVPQNSLGVWNA